MSEKSTIQLEIDGAPLTARPGQSVIEVADANGIVIPRFCYHKKLSVAANCRMCLVDVERAPKPLPACATLVADGMKVWTESPKALAAQRGVMEFLLINHPLDCPICDQGGECDLQEMSLGFGGDLSRYGEPKRIVIDKNYGPLVATDMTRCIHCTRCVRLSTEIAGLPELGGTGRGEWMEIGPYVEHTLVSELSGNMIDVCPVGALTSKPFRYDARPWELTSVEGIAPHDALGSNLSIQVYEGRVRRVLPRENEALNECWLSDRDRFSYLGLRSPDRLLRPMARDADGVLRECDWQSALERAATALRDIAAAHGGDAIAALASPSSTTEEFYLLQKWLRGLGCGRIDHRLRRGGALQQAALPAPGLEGIDAAGLERVDVALLVGCDLRSEQPLLAHRLRKAAARGAQIFSINPRRFDLLCATAGERTTANMGGDLATVARLLLAQRKEGADDARWPGLADLVAPNDAASDDGEEDDFHRALAQALAGAQRGFVLLGALADASVAADAVDALAVAVAGLSGAALGRLPPGANAAGGWLAGALPHRAAGGASIASPPRAALDEEDAPRALVLLGVEPRHDLRDGEAALQAVERADFVLSLAAFHDPDAERHAQVVLPIAAFAESSGSFVNLHREWQSFRGAVAPPGEARPAWKVLRVLANLCGVAGFDYLSSEEALMELRALCDGEGSSHSNAWRCPDALPEGDGAPPPLPIYRVDALTRRAAALQRTPLGAATTADATATTESAGA